MWKVENVCRDNQHVVATMMWPGVYLSCVLCSIFVFDMALDTNDLDLGAPLAFSIFPLCVGFVVRLIFFSVTQKEAKGTSLFRHGLEARKNSGLFITINNPIGGEVEMNRMSGPRQHE